jgi:glycerophosphoryl diester phosphodiesterase
LFFFASLRLGESIFLRFYQRFLTKEGTPMQMPNPVQVVCHKGANKLAPENTFAAARLCVEWGVEYVEIDVNTSVDGVLYIFHGPNLEHTTNGSGRIEAHTAAELDLLDASNWFSRTFAGEHIPRLEEYLRWIKGKAKIFLDIKNCDPHQIANLIYATGFENDCFFWSSDSDWMHRLHKLDPRLALKVNVKTIEDARRAKEEFGAAFVEIGPENLTPELVVACHELGQQVMVMYPGNSPEVFRQIIAGGADLINTDYGDEFLKVRG